MTVEPSAPCEEEKRSSALRRAWDDALLFGEDDTVERRARSIDYLASGDPCGGPPAVARHVYAGLEPLEEHLCCSAAVPGFDPADFALAREFIWGDRFPQPVALVTHGGLSGGFGGSSVPAGESAYHYLHDVLGSVVALTNPSGQVVERYTYDPYGKTVMEVTNPTTGLPTARLKASAFGNPFAWTGQRYDAGVRLYHFLFRGYSPQLGRWLQRDVAGYVDGVSLYQYVESDPLYYVDPDGLGKVGIVIKTVKGIYKWIRPGTARKAVEKGKDVTVKGPGSSRKAKKLAKDTIGKDKKIDRHDGHKPGQKPHYQAKKGDGRHVKYVVPGSGLGVTIFGDNWFGHGVNFFNPLSDVQDIVDLFQDDEEGCPDEGDTEQEIDEDEGEVEGDDGQDSGGEPEEEGGDGSEGDAPPDSPGEPSGSEP